LFCKSLDIWLIEYDELIVRVGNSSDFEDAGDFTFRFFKSDFLDCGGNVEWAKLDFKIKYYDLLLFISLVLVRVNYIWLLETWFII
jgi:hypothetical protein